MGPMYHYSVTSISGGAFASCNRLTDVYYGGSAGQWKQISIDNDYSENSWLLNATIHYNSTW